MKWQDQYRDKLVTSEEAAKLVKPGNKVVFSLLAQPKTLGFTLAQRQRELPGITLTSNWLEDYPWLKPGWGESVLVQTGFGTRATREALRQKTIDWIPVAFGLHDGKRYTAPMRDGVYHGADVFMGKAAPPDNDGQCSFGHHIWCSPTALRTAKLAIVEIDETLPWTYGDNVHISEIDFLVETPASEFAERITDSISVPLPEDWEMSQVIGAHAASIIKNGVTLQIGIGTPCESVLNFLGDKNDLGVDGELIYTQTIELIRKGVFTGKHKEVDRGKHVTSGLFLYEGDPRNAAALTFVNRNFHFEFRDISYMCNVPRIASIKHMFSINTLLSIDLLGQANISHLGTSPIGGPGGQIEYAIGAHYSEGGGCISCLLSTAKGGTISRIVPQHEKGAVILMPCVYVDYLVTEHGIANLDGKSARQRADAIISVAHPNFQPWLSEEAKKIFGSC